LLQQKEKRRKFKQESKKKPMKVPMENITDKNFSTRKRNE
jgi:hypothetical protein